VNPILQQCLDAIQMSLVMVERRMPPTMYAGNRALGGQRKVSRADAETLIRGWGIGRRNPALEGEHAAQREASARRQAEGPPPPQEQTGMFPHAPTMESQYDNEMNLNWMKPAEQAEFWDEAERPNPNVSWMKPNEQGEFFRMLEARRTPGGGPSGQYPHAPTMESNYCPSFMGQPAPYGDLMYASRAVMMTPALARAASMDAANRRMRAAGRTAWDEDDFNHASDVFAQLAGNSQTGGNPHGMGMGNPHGDGAPAEYMDEPDYDYDLGPGIPMDTQENEHDRWTDKQDDVYWEHRDATLDNTDWMREFSTPDALYSQYAEQIPWDGPDPTEGRDEEWVQQQAMEQAVWQAIMNRNRYTPQPGYPGGTPIPGRPGGTGDLRTGQRNQYAEQIPWDGPDPTGGQGINNEPFSSENIRQREAQRGMPAPGYPGGVPIPGRPGGTGDFLKGNRAYPRGWSGASWGDITSEIGGMGADLGDALGFSAYAGFDVPGKDRDRMFWLPIGELPAERSRFLSGFDPGAHVVNKPRRTGTMTDDAQRKIFDAWKPQYARYAGPRGGYGGARKVSHKDAEDFIYGVGARRKQQRGNFGNQASSDEMRERSERRSMPGDKATGRHPHAPTMESQYADTGNWPPSVPPSDSDARLGNPQVGYDDERYTPEQTVAHNKWMEQHLRQRKMNEHVAAREIQGLGGNEDRQWLARIEAQRRAAGPGPVDPNNYASLGWTNQDELEDIRQRRMADDERRAQTMRETSGDPFRPTPSPGAPDQILREARYAEHGYPEFSRVPHGSARRPLERPGFLPSMIRSPHASTGQFHTGMPGDHIVGQPHPSNRQPPGGHVPAGFYDMDERRERFQELIGQYPNHDLPPFYRPFGTVGADIGDYPDHGSPGAPPMRRSGEDEFRARQRLHGTGYGGLYDGPYEGPYGDAPMHGPGSWNDPTNHLLNDLGRDWKFHSEQPLGGTNTPRDDDSGEVEWERNIAEGNMGGYAAYGDQDFQDPFGMDPRSPGYPNRTLEQQRAWFDSLRDEPDQSQTLTDPFGRTHPPTMPGNEYAGYATSIPVDPNGPMASTPGDVLDDYNQQDDLRQRWNKFWSSPGTDDYRAPYFPQKPNQGQDEYCGYDDMSGEVDYASSCMSMLDKLHSLRPTIYGEAGAGDDSGRFGGGFGDDTEPVGGTPDRDYWRKKTPYADQPSSHMDMSPEKARKILHDGEVHGHPLTKKQRGLFGSVAGRG
jgi:hypothetical protein